MKESDTIKERFSVPKKNTENQRTEYIIHGVPLKELQACELEILKVFISVCKNNNLQYYLAGGTLLGAVRHRGFIPWDDDMDVIMPRKDYEKFIWLAEQYDSKYEVLNCYTDKKCRVIYSKFIDSSTSAIRSSRICAQTKQGVWMDIFPLDRSPKSILFRIILFLREKILSACCVRFTPSEFMRSNKKSKRNKVTLFLKRIIAQLFYRKCSLNELVRRRDNLIKSFVKKDTGFVCNYAGRAMRLPESVFGKGILMKFEGIPVVVPNKYDVWLKKLYGLDYMKIPPLEKQKVKHLDDVAILDLKHSYHTYLDEEGNFL